MKRICKICGKEFDSHYGRHYCSSECREIGYRLSRKKNRIIKPAEPEIKCAHCGKVFRPRSKTQQYCSAQCRIDDKHPLIEKICDSCGKKFVTSSKKKRYCSSECLYNCSKPQCESPPMSKPKPRTKTLADWCREANECNLDYGNYRALIESGKTFDELKANADSRQLPAHSHLRKGMKHS